MYRRRNVMNKSGVFESDDDDDELSLDEQLDPVTSEGDRRCQELEARKVRLLSICSLDKRQIQSSNQVFFLSIQ